MLLEEQLSEEFLSYQDVTVTGYYSSEMKEIIRENILEAGKLTGADYILSGSISNSENNKRIGIKLLVPETGEVLLCKSFERKTLSPEIIKVIIGITIECYHILIRNWKQSKVNKFQAAMQ